MHEEKLGLMKFYPFLRCYWQLMPAGGKENWFPSGIWFLRDYHVLVEDIIYLRTYN